MADGRLAYRQVDDALEIAVHGDWVLTQADRLAKTVARARERMQGARRVHVDGSDAGRIDTSGAWLLQKIIRAARSGDRRVAVEGFDAVDFQLVADLSDLESGGEHCEGVRCYTFGDQFVGLGINSHKGLLHLLDATAFIGRTMATFTRCAGRPARMRLPAVVANVHRAGVNAIPIVALLSFLIAIVMAYQGASQLARFGAEIFTVQLTAVSMLREMGPLVTAILVAGRSGSAFTAEIGVMKVREEIDAIQTMGLDPYEVLVLPRVMALMLMLPLLTLVANLAGLAGAAFTVGFLMDLPLDAYFTSARDALTPWNFWSGMIKTPVFAFIIATTATFWGLQVAGSADSVGRRTTVSVVQSIFLVILADAAFALIYIQLGL